jgi:hypothetical protein
MNGIPCKRRRTLANEDVIFGAILGVVTSVIGSVVVFFLEHFLAARIEEKSAYTRLVNSLYLEVKHNLTIAGFPDNLKLGYLEEIVSLAVRTGDINLLPVELCNSTLNILTQVKPVAETTLKRDGVKQMQELKETLGKLAKIKEQSPTVKTAS